jgi:geranylgeranyl diphosphate synthase type II
LTLAAGELFGARDTILLPFACAIEMIHAYSLIHDDLPALDDDDLRRGEPTTHKVFGEGVALLAGDALLTEAFHLMTSPQATRSLPAELVLEIVHDVSHAAGMAGLVGGQALDIEAEGQGVDLATVEYIHVRKTGALLLASACVGAKLARAKPSDLRRISRFAKFLGLAFQIADDVLDIQGQSGEGEGAESGHKERRKATYPSVVGLAQAKERLRELLQQSLKELAPFGRPAEPLAGVATYIIRRAIDEEANRLIQEINL